MFYVCVIREPETLGRSDGTDGVLARARSATCCHALAAPRCCTTSLLWLLVYPRLHHRPKFVFFECSKQGEEGLKWIGEGGQWNTDPEPVIRARVCGQKGRREGPLTVTAHARLSEGNLGHLGL